MSDQPPQLFETFADDNQGKQITNQSMIWSLAALAFFFLAYRVFRSEARHNYVSLGFFWFFPFSWGGTVFSIIGMSRGNTGRGKLPMNGSWRASLSKFVNVITLVLGVLATAFSLLLILFFFALPR
ncbi:MAG: hypothetical protein FWG02_00200 [Holophagaceae bacterium]|nr:hypothetical protein [Holophagaceae bacterium]